MKFQEINKMLVGGFASLMISFVLTLVCLCINGWAELDRSNIEMTGGLWRECITVSGDETCDDIENPPKWLKACRALVIIALILTGVAIIMTIYFMVKTKMSGQDSNRLLTIGILVNGSIAVTFQFMVHIIFGVEYKDDFGGSNVELSHTYGLHVVSNFFVLMGSLLVFFSYRKGE